MNYKNITRYYYETFYSQILGIDSRGILKFLSAYPHKLMEREFQQSVDKVLEVGFGEGEHFKYVDTPIKEYVGIDLDRKRLFKRNYPKYVKRKVMNAEKINYPDDYFDRVIATCLLAHLQNPEVALYEWKRVLKNSGVCTIYIPLEPSIALRIFRFILMKRKLKKIGFSQYDLFIAREHINHATRLLVFVKSVFEKDEIKIIYRPFPIQMHSINLFAIIHIKKLSE